MSINKSLFRAAIAIIFIVYLFLVLAFFTNTLGSLEALQERYVLIRLSLALLGVLGGGSAIGIWVAMLYHWKHNAFNNQRTRLGWLALLLGLNFLGAIIYYATFIEFSKKRDEIRRG